MMLVLLTAAGVLGGLLIGVGGTLLWHARRVDAHEWRKVRLATVRVDKLWRDLDHYRRLARRRGAQLDHVLTDARDWVGHLLDVVADRDRELDRLTRPRHLRHSAMVEYGPHRGAA